MSKINELIQTLCPDGVEYKKLGEVATNMFRGNGIKRDEVTENGTPCVRYGEIYTIYDIWFDTCVSHTDVDRLKSPKYFGYGAVLIAITGESVLDIAKSTVYVGHEKCLAGGDILVVEHKQNPKYMGYVLSTTDAQDQKSAGKIKSKVVHASAKDLAEIVIPVPPLPVQDEIVRILDEYTALEAELEAKLSEEIELKQKQYEYCASKLFEDLNVEYISMSELAKFKYGYTDKASDSGNARFIRITDIDDFGELSSADEKYITLTDDAEKYLLTKGSLVVARTGATYGKTLYFDSDEPSVYASFLIKIDFDNNQVLNRYYWHFTKTSLYWEQANKYVKVGGQQQFNSPALGRVCVPVPSLTEQERIVKTLDKYDTYTRDMISALNTELESRKKQYAYYRDQLLTFKRKEV